MADISVSAPKKPYQSISTVNVELKRYVTCWTISKP